MELRCGIIGLPNVGKSGLFNAISKGNAPSANFPFCTIKPNQEIVTVPDPRLSRLVHLVKPEKVIPATLFIVDIAGLVKGASRGEGLGNQFLGHIREVDALIHVIRCFDDDQIVHVAGGVNPLFDREIINEELQLADISTLEKRQKKIEKQVKAGQENAVREMALLEKFIASLKKGKDGRSLFLDKEEQKIVNMWSLLTCKKVIYVANVGESTLEHTKNRYVEDLGQAIKEEKTEVTPICVVVEEELARLHEKDQTDFLEMYGLKKTSIDNLLQAAYKMLDIINFYTVGPKEVRAWTIRRGTLAPDAAGVIHSDFSKNFIKAEVIHYDDYIKYGSEEASKRAGRMAIEGKSYVVQDGDIIHFKCSK